MTLMFDRLKILVVKKIMALDLPDFTEDKIYSLLSTAPDLKMGHLAFPCFQLAKALRKGPPQIAAEIKEKLEIDENIVEINNAGPYLNFKFSVNCLGDLAIAEVLNKNSFAYQLTKNAPKTMIEYSQPNTHKVLHVGHMRNLCLGDALIKLLRYCNYPIISATFPGDVGTHVAKCLWYLKHHNQDEIPTEHKGAWLGQIYTKATLKLDEELGTEKEEQNRSELTEILKQLEVGSGEYFDQWKETREWSIALMQEIYDWANVTFDQWYWESEVDSDSVKLIQKYYEKGLFIKDEGAIGIDLSDHKLGFCLLIKSDGNGLYATKDIELARRKFEDHQIEKNIYIVDKRQAHHFKQVFKTLELMGFEQAKDCYHLQYDFVELPDGAMSSRKGNIVPLQELVESMITHVKDNYLNKYADSWSEEKILKVANEVAKGAIKYGMIRMDNSKKIVFDMNDWLRLDGESGPYIQYSHARIFSLCKKQGYNPDSTINWSILNKNEEMALMLKISEFNSVIKAAAVQYKTHSVTSYLYELAKLFNSFYAECSIAHAENDELKVARLALARATSLCLAKGLELLGIPAPEEM
jgi:arginyl-tRNA synthetase